MEGGADAHGLWLLNGFFTPPNFKKIIIHPPTLHNKHSLPHLKTPKQIMVDEVYDGAIGIDLGITIAAGKG